MVNPALIVPLCKIADIAVKLSIVSRRDTFNQNILITLACIKVFTKMFIGSTCHSYIIDGNFIQILEYYQFSMLGSEGEYSKMR